MENYQQIGEDITYRKAEHNRLSTLPKQRAAELPNDGNASNPYQGARYLKVVPLRLIQALVMTRGP
jgi:hypothetical protein